MVERRGETDWGGDVAVWAPIRGWKDDGWWWRRNAENFNWLNFLEDRVVDRAGRLLGDFRWRRSCAATVDVSIGRWRGEDGRCGEFVKTLQPGVGRCGAIVGVWIGVRGRLAGRGNFSPGPMVTCGYVMVGRGIGGGWAALIDGGTITRRMAG